MVSQIWQKLAPIALVSSLVSAECIGDAWDVIVVGTKMLNAYDTTSSNC
jgi:hypothetical protein